MMRKIIVHKGTTIKDKKIKHLEWAGETFKDYQNEKMKDIPPKTRINLERGTNSTLVTKYPKSNKKSYSGGYILSTKRGTSSRRI